MKRKAALTGPPVLGLAERGAMNSLTSRGMRATLSSSDASAGRPADRVGMLGVEAVAMAGDAGTVPASPASRAFGSGAGRLAGMAR